MLLDEHADVIREAVKAVAAEMMELEVSRRRTPAARHRHAAVSPSRWRIAGRHGAPGETALGNLAIGRYDRLAGRAERSYCP